MVYSYADFLSFGQKERIKLTKLMDEFKGITDDKYWMQEYRIRAIILKQKNKKKRKKI